MGKRFFLCPLLILLLGLAAGAADFDPDSYGGVADYLDGIYGADDNAGLTAFPLLNIPIGGRAEGMASSFSAVADDASFLESNPAGSARLARSELAVFHNNWIADTKIEGMVYTQRLGNLGLAAGAKWLYTPFTEYDLYGSRVSKGYYSEAEAILNGSYNLFSGYKFSGISLGANLKGAFRFVPDYADKSSGEVLPGSGKEQSAAMAMADIGLLTRFDFLKFYPTRERNSSIGLVIRNLGPPSLGESLPTEASAGLSYKPLRPLLLSFDFSLPLNLGHVNLSEKPYWAAGLAVSFTDFLSLHTGVRAKPGNIRIALGSGLIFTGKNAEKGGISLDMNYTLDMLTQIQPLNRLSLGIRVDLGDRGRQAKANQVDTLYLSGLEAYAQGEYTAALQDWREALELDPQYLPAQESLSILEEALAVQRRMDELQQLNF
jgi:tetratricopeptide (TPR) repeat protein